MEGGKWLTGCCRGRPASARLSKNDANRPLLGQFFSDLLQCYSGCCGAIAAGGPGPCSGQFQSPSPSASLRCTVTRPIQRFSALSLPCAKPWTAQPVVRVSVREDACDACHARIWGIVMPVSLSPRSLKNRANSRRTKARLGAASHGSRVSDAGLQFLQTFPSELAALPFTCECSCGIDAEVDRNTEHVSTLSIYEKLKIYYHPISL